MNIPAVVALAVGGRQYHCRTSRYRGLWSTRGDANFWDDRTICVDCGGVFDKGLAIVKSPCPDCGSRKLVVKLCRYQTRSVKKRVPFLWIFRKTVYDTEGEWIVRDEET